MKWVMSEPAGSSACSVLLVSQSVSHAGKIQCPVQLVRSPELWGRGSIGIWQVMSEHKYLYRNKIKLSDCEVHLTICNLKRRWAEGRREDTRGCATNHIYFNLFLKPEQRQQTFNGFVYVICDDPIKTSIVTLMGCTVHQTKQALDNHLDYIWNLLLPPSTALVQTAVA